MEIYSIRIDGISNIDRASLEFDTINALVAPNGYGKSNILHAIEFGIKFMTATEQERASMLNSRFKPNNLSISGSDFLFEITGKTNLNGSELLFVYCFKAAWATDSSQGSILYESLKVKAPSDQRYRQQIDRKTANECFIVPSATGRCTKRIDLSGLQLALSLIANSSVMYLCNISKQIANIDIPNVQTLDNPESYFAIEGGKELKIFGGMTLSQYLYNLSQNDVQNYSILKDGLQQLIPSITEFSPEVIVLADGQRKIYDVRIRERHTINPTSISLLSSGSKRMIFLFTLCIAACKQGIPMIMLEEPENSVHPRLMENLLLTLKNYATNTKILLTSHSPYLMRYLLPGQMWFGLPNNNGIATFAKVKPSKLKSLYRYAGDMELTFGEFMFDFMLDIEDDNEKLSTYFEYDYGEK